MRKKLLAGILAIATLFTCTCTAVACNNKDDVSVGVEETVETDSESGFSTELENTEHVQLLAVTPLMATVGSNYVSQTLEAVVYPQTAENKQVDWSVAWADASNTANVADYVTVTPSSDGSTTATVTCYKEFSGNIVITVTTRESGYMANCVVKFVGIPTEMNVTTEVSEQDGYYHLGIGKTHAFNVALNNPFHSVGADYQNVTATLKGVGEVTLCNKSVQFGFGNVTWHEASSKTCTLESLKDKFININYADGVLTVKTLRSIESYYAGQSILGTSVNYIDHFKEFVTDCYFTVTLTEETSGITKTIKIRFDDSIVTGVGITSGELLF